MLCLWEMEKMRKGVGSDGKWQGEGVKAVICLLQVSPAVHGALLFDVGLQGKSCSHFR